MWLWSVLRAGWITVWCALKPHARWRPTNPTSTTWTHNIENENSIPSLQILSVVQFLFKSKSFLSQSRNSLRYVEYESTITVFTKACLSCARSIQSTPSHLISLKSSLTF
jgi:hypothetical protein